MKKTILILTTVCSFGLMSFALTSADSTPKNAKSELRELSKDKSDYKFYPSMKTKLQNNGISIGN